jgi:hypothetical protein
MIIIMRHEHKGRLSGGRNKWEGEGRKERVLRG